MRRTTAGSDLATSTPGGQRIWPRKRGNNPASTRWLARRRRAAVLRLDVAAAVSPLRAAWARKGTQATVPFTGSNAKRVLFGAINLRTAHRVVLIRPRAGAVDAQAFLRELRRRYRTAGTIWLLVDRASAHTAARTH